MLRGLVSSGNDLGIDLHICDLGTGLHRLQAADCIIPPCTSNPLIPQIPVESVKPVSCGLLD